MAATESFDMKNTTPSETIRMMAAFLEHMTQTNDQVPRKRILTRFHARTIPSIDILGYLTRILKYAPCGSECFLAVLVYFDRMSVGSAYGSLGSSAAAEFAMSMGANAAATTTTNTTTRHTDTDTDRDTYSHSSQRHHPRTSHAALADPSSSASVSASAAASSDSEAESTSSAELVSGETAMGLATSAGRSDGSSSGRRQAIVINSFNIHRLLIAGCMVAVKFLSDVFYTNSHVAKVGGLPVQELNRLEIEFLMFNDFNLNVTPADLQACGDRILAFDRERAALQALQDQQALQAQALPPHPPLPSHSLQAHSAAAQHQPVRSLHPAVPSLIAPAPAPASAAAAVAAAQGSQGSHGSQASNPRVPPSDSSASGASPDSTHHRSPGPVVDHIGSNIGLVHSFAAASSAASQPAGGLQKSAASAVIAPANVIRGFIRSIGGRARGCSV
eukprot:jgi/Hompol1/5649/HPOL_002016-RA